MCVLQEFLQETSTVGYAGGGAQRFVDPETGSTRLRWNNGPWTWLDEYDTSLDGRTFSGRERVWRSAVRIWSLAYFGQVIPGVDPEEVFTILKKAMAANNDWNHTRGPAVYHDGDWEYRCHYTGTVAGLCGEEEILHKGRVVYKGIFGGGLLIDEDVLAA